MRLGSRVARLEGRVPPPRAPRPDLPALYRKLEALGLAVWDAGKGYWSPTEDPDPRRQLREAIRERTRG